MRVNTIVLWNNTYSDAPNKANIREVNLNNVNWKYNSMISAFNRCNRLTSVTNINENVTNMTSTFSGCSNLVDAPEIPDNVTNMAYTFYNCYSLKNLINFPNNVIDIQNTFWNCTNLVNVPEIPNSVTNMYSTFYNCNNLVDAPVIPDSVTDMEFTFHGCTNLVNAPVIPNSVTDMWATFAECKNLILPPDLNNATNLNMMSYAFSGCSNLVNAPVIPNSVKYMQDTFGDCISLVDAPEIPENVTSMIGTFNRCYGLKNAPTIYSKYDLYMHSTFLNCVELTNIPNIVENIRITSMNNTFRNCSNLIDATLNCSSIINMHNTFWNCSNLVNVALNCSSITNMNNTFYNCQKLANVTLDCSDIDYMYYTFQNCQELANVTLNCVNIISMEGTFYNCTNLVNAPEIPDSVTIMNHTFFNCQSLVNVPQISNSVTYMYSTFQNCYSLTNIPELPGSIIALINTFAYCNNLVDAPVIPNSVTNMIYTFYSCTNLKNVPEIPDSVTIMDGTFYNCNSLENISKISNNTTSMYRTFYNCYNLVNIPDMSNSINLSYMAYAFWNCQKLTGNFNIPSENIYNVEGIFDETSLEKNVYIPFYYSNGAYTYTYNTFINNGYSDSIVQNGVLLRDINNENRLLEWTYFNNENGITTLFNYIGENDIVLMPLYKTELSNYSAEHLLFSNNQNIINVSLGNINVINNDLSYAFYNCSKLETINYINKNISNFSHTFDNCINLTGNIIIPCENINDISNCFDNTTLEKNVYIPFDIINGVKTQSYNIFVDSGYSTSVAKNGVLLKDYWDEEITTKWIYVNSNNRILKYMRTNVSDVIIPPTNTIINSGSGSYASYYLYNCPFYNNQTVVNADLRYVSFVNNSMDNAFRSCTNLKSVININQNVVNMTHAFSGCSNLVNAPEIPNSVTYMSSTFASCFNLVNIPNISNCTNLINMSYAFYGCHELNDNIIIPNNVTNMAYTFSNCQKLNSDIFILSADVNNIYGIFDNTTLEKNVYIPYEYENGVYTNTYKAFTSQNYSETIRKNGVLISNIGAKVTFNVTPINDTLIYLNGKMLNSTTSYSKPGINEYILQNSGYPIFISKFNAIDLTQNIIVTKDLTSVTGYTITLNVDQTDCEVTFDINGVKIPAVVNGNNYSITLNTDEEISIGYVVKKSGYRKVSNTLTFNNSNITENITMEETSSIEYDFQYPFNDVSELSELVDENNFIVNTNLQAITSGPSSYYVSSGTSYGYITFTTENACELLINGYVSSESGYDFGGVYVGKQKQIPTSGQINNGTIFSDNGQWLFHYSGNGSSSDYTMQLDANTTYVLTFAYAKDGSGNSVQDRLIINRIKFDGIIEENS